MRNDLIGRNTLHESMKMQRYRVIDGVEYIRRETVLKKIQTAPHVEAATVVRCKQCALRNTIECPMRTSGSGSYIGHGMYDEGSDKTKDNGFCYKGVKRWEGD